MLIPKFIRRLWPVGSVLIMENNPKNERKLQALFKKHKMKTVWVGSYEEATTLFKEKSFLGVVLDHEFRNDPDHRGYDLLRFIRENQEGFLNFPVYLVGSLLTADLIEYEHLKIVKYFDTEETLVGPVVEEIAEYFMPRE